MISKVVNPNRAHQFQPISLCTTIYKAIAKLLVNRSKQLLKKIIGPYQKAFAPERAIQDNILLVQEILNMYNMSKNKTGLLALKLDMKKAYDRI